MTATEGNVSVYARAAHAIDTLRKNATPFLRSFGSLIICTSLFEEQIANHKMSTKGDGGGAASKLNAEHELPVDF